MERFEITMKSENTGAVYSLGYSINQTHDAIFSQMTLHREAIWELCKLTIAGQIKVTEHGLQFIEDHDTWTVEYTGRTQGDPESAPRVDSAIRAMRRSARAAALNESRRMFREIVARGEAAGSLDRETVQRMRTALYFDKYFRFRPSR